MSALDPMGGRGGGQGAPSRPDVLCPTQPAEPGLHLSLRLSSVQPDFIIHRSPSLYVRAFYFIFFYPGSGFHVSKEILGIYVVTPGSANLFICRYLAGRVVF